MADKTAAGAASAAGLDAAGVVAVADVTVVAGGEEAAMSADALGLPTAFGGFKSRKKRRRRRPHARGERRVRAKGVDGKPVVPGVGDDEHGSASGDGGRAGGEDDDGGGGDGNRDGDTNVEGDEGEKEASECIPVWDAASPLHKYWRQRHRLFSRYDEGVQIDDEGWFSVTPEALAAHTAGRMVGTLAAETAPRAPVILDGFCGVGGNSIQFALAGAWVIAVDNCAERLEAARHNANVYGVAEFITFCLGDYFDVAARLAGSPQPVDGVFLSPPWGGPGYVRSPHFDVNTDFPAPLTCAAIMAAARTLSPHIVLFLPKNSILDSIARHVRPADATGAGPGLEIERNLAFGKLKAITAYYVAGDGTTFPATTLDPCSEKTFTVFANVTHLPEYLEVQVELSSPAVGTNTVTVQMVRALSAGSSDVVPIPELVCTVADGKTQCNAPLRVACQYAATNNSVYYVTVSTQSDGTLPVTFTLSANVDSVTIVPMAIDKATSATAAQPTPTILAQEYMFFSVDIDAKAIAAGSQLNFTVHQAAANQFAAAYINHDALACAEGVACSLPVHYSDGCTFAGNAKCTFYVDTCSLVAHGAGTYVVALKVATAGSTFTITPGVSQPAVMPLRSGVPVVAALPDTKTIALYYLDVHAPVDVATLTIEVTQVENGVVKVGQAFEALPFESCATHGGSDTSVVCAAADAFCHATTQGCKLFVGRYYFGVQATTLNVANRDVTYVIEATAVRRDGTIRLSSGAPALPQTVQATAYKFYELPQSRGEWMDVHLYLDSTPDLPGLTLYINPGALAGAGPQSALCYDHVQHCSVSAGNNPGCTLQISQCDLGSSPWFASVVGNVGNFYGDPIAYTIEYSVRSAIALSPGYVKPQSFAVKAGIYDHYVINEPWLGKEVVVVLNATLSSVDYFINYGSLAGECPCYHSITSGSLDAQGGTRDSIAIPLNNCGNAPGHGKIYIAIRGTDQASQYSKYIVSYEIHEAYVPRRLSAGTTHDLVPVGDSVQYWEATRPPSDAFLRVAMSGGIGGVVVLVDDAENPGCRPSQSVGYCLPELGLGSECLVVVPPCELASTSSVVLATSGTAAAGYGLQYSYVHPQVVRLSSGRPEAARLGYGVPARYSINVPNNAFSSVVIELYLDAGQQGTATMYVSHGEVPGASPCFDAQHECSTSERCAIVLDPCQVAPGDYYIALHSEFNQANIADLGYTIKATVSDAVVKASGPAPFSVSLFESQVVYVTYETSDVASKHGSVYSVEVGNVADGSLAIDMFYGAPQEDCKCLVYAQSQSLSTSTAFGYFDVDYCQVNSRSVVTFKLEATTVKSAPQTLRQLGATLTFADRQHTVVPIEVGVASDAVSLANRQYVMYQVTSAKPVLAAATSPPPPPAVPKITTVTVDNVSPYQAGVIEVWAGFDSPATASCSLRSLCSGVSNCSVQISPCEENIHAGKPLFVSVRATTATTTPVTVTTMVSQDEVRKLAPSATQTITLQAPRSTVVALDAVLAVNSAFRVVGQSVVNGDVRLRMLPSLCQIGDTSQSCVILDGGESCSISASPCTAYMSPDTAGTFYVSVEALKGSPSVTLEFQSAVVQTTSLSQGVSQSGTLLPQAWTSYYMTTTGFGLAKTQRLAITVTPTSGASDLKVYLRKGELASNYVCASAECETSKETSGKCEMAVGACCLEPNTNYFVSILNAHQVGTDGTTFDIVATQTSAASTPQALQLTPNPTTAQLQPQVYSEYSFSLDGTAEYGSSVTIVVNTTEFRGSAVDVFVAKGEVAGAGTVVQPANPPACFTSFAQCEGKAECVVQLFAECHGVDGVPTLTQGTYYVAVRPSTGGAPPPQRQTPARPPATPTRVNAQFVSEVVAPNAPYTTLELDVALHTTGGSAQVYVNTGPWLSAGPAKPYSSGPAGVALAGLASTSACFSASPAVGTTCTAGTPCKISVPLAFCGGMMVRVGVVGGAGASTDVTLTLTASGSSIMLASGATVALPAASGDTYYEILREELEYAVVAVGANSDVTVATSGEQVCFGLGPQFPSLSCTTSTNGTCSKVLTVYETSYNSVWFKATVAGTAPPTPPPSLTVTTRPLPIVPLAADGTIHQLYGKAETAVAYAFEVPDGWVAPGQSLVLSVGAPSCGSMSVYVSADEIGGQLQSMQSCSSGCNVTLASACGALSSSVSGRTYYATVVLESTDFPQYAEVETVFSLQLRREGDVTSFGALYLGGASPAADSSGQMLSYTYGLTGKVVSNFESLVVKLALPDDARGVGALTAAVGTPVRGCATSPKSCTVQVGERECSISFAVCELQPAATALDALYVTSYEVDGSGQLANASIWLLPDFGFVQEIRRDSEFSGVIYSTSSEAYVVPLENNRLVDAPEFQLSLALETFGMPGVLGLAAAAKPSPQCVTPAGSLPSEIVVEYCEISKYASEWPVAEQAFVSVVANAPGSAELVPYALSAQFAPEVIRVGAGPTCYTMGESGTMYFESTLARGAVRLWANVTSSASDVTLHVNVGRLASATCGYVSCNVASGAWEGNSCVAEAECPLLQPVSGKHLPGFMTVNASPGTKFVLSSGVVALKSIQKRVVMAEPLQIEGAGEADVYYEVSLPNEVRSATTALVVWAVGLDDVTYSAYPFPTNGEQCGIAGEASMATSCVGSAGLERVCYAIEPCSWSSGKIWLHLKKTAPLTSWPYNETFTAAWSVAVSVVDYVNLGAAHALDPTGASVEVVGMPGKLAAFEVDVSKVDAFREHLHFAVSGLNAGSLWSAVYVTPIDGAGHGCAPVGDGAGVVTTTGGRSHNLTVPVCRFAATKYYGLVLPLTGATTECGTVSYTMGARVETHLPVTQVSAKLGQNVGVSLNGGGAGVTVQYDRSAGGWLNEQALVVDVAPKSGVQIHGSVIRQGGLEPDYELCEVALEGSQYVTVIPSCLIRASNNAESQVMVRVFGESSVIATAPALANVTVRAARYEVMTSGRTYSGELGWREGDASWLDTKLYQAKISGGASTGVVVDVGEGGGKVMVEVRPGGCFNDYSAPDKGSGYMENSAVFECYGGRCVFSFDRLWTTPTAAGQSDMLYNILVRGARTKYSLTVGNGRGNCGRHRSAFCGAAANSWRWLDDASQNDGAEQLFTKLYCAFHKCGSQCPVEVSKRCNDTLRAFACATTYPGCDSHGLLTPPCLSLCTAVEKACGEKFAAVRLEQYDCTHNYFTQKGPCTGLPSTGAGSSGLSAGLIVLIVLSVLVVLGAAGAAVVWFLRRRQRSDGYEPVPSDEAINAPTPTPVNDPGPPPAGEVVPAEA
ncbi:uncharacterized protein AMSG_05495 [Thecamonas trahens ATCC 50062]|uniref:Trimethylguanosine synthase n=1 Tax=Thecamonas trahens ATCC 50062 TaxID=461836 RepID=A0A0L0DAU6_THETB|nr:hypothetical protein AMSG_05495 [Thecamonas trahens ATCC 50062]KNC49479.1 hypothetical protein AMSG_05495 [Thecamonas trahens ATCC 50062]|eukprot:XP_013757898.1 hypothetical protein AMSG_05495 [Thecamonas trahens ATCC 50062]